MELDKLASSGPIKPGMALIEHDIPELFCPNCKVTIAPTKPPVVINVYQINTGVADIVRAEILKAMPRIAAAVGSM